MYTARPYPSALMYCMRAVHLGILHITRKRRVPVAWSVCAHRSIKDASRKPVAKILTPEVDLLEMSEEIKSSFLSYALSTILSRALPDVRDGLKPVHRRVLYAMHAIKLSPDSPFRKCARIVGEVLGKYHPHGDQSVYEALVRFDERIAH